MQSEGIEVIGTVLGARPVDQTRTLWTIRLRLPSGAGFPFWSHPDLTTIYVETGTLGFTTVTGNVNLSLGTNPAVTERAFTGREYLLQPGDAALFGPGVMQSIRNPVTEITTILVTMIAPNGSTPYNGLSTSEGYVIRVAGAN